MSVSVVMAAYNAAAYIDEAIRSVLNQSLADWELIVVDDGSKDQTIAIVQSYLTDPRIRLIERATNGGPAAARREGTFAAQYDHISYLDSDDRLCPDTLKVLLAALTASPGAVLAYADFVRIDADGRRHGLHRLPVNRTRPQGDVLREFLGNNHMPNGGCALIRRDVLIQADCWRSDLPCAEDWVAWTILATYGEFVFVPGFKALEYRELATGLSQVINIHFEKAMPAIRAVYGDDRVAKRVAPAELERLRKRREANMWAYLAALNIRRGRVGPSLHCLFKALATSQGQAPGLITKYVLTWVGRFF